MLQTFNGREGIDLFFHNKTARRPLDSKMLKFEYSQTEVRHGRIHLVLALTSDYGTNKLT